MRCDNCEPWRSKQVDVKQIFSPFNTQTILLCLTIPVFHISQPAVYEFEMHRLPAPGGLLEKTSRQSLIITSLDSHHDWQLWVKECRCVFVGDVSFQFFKSIVILRSPEWNLISLCVKSLNGFVSKASKSHFDCPRIARETSSEELGTMSRNNLRGITLVRGPI